MWLNTSTLINIRYLNNNYEDSVSEKMEKHFSLSPTKWNESEVAQSCPTLSDPMDCSPPGSSIHGIFQARVLEWGAIAFSYSPTKYTKSPGRYL